MGGFKRKEKERKIKKTKLADQLSVNTDLERIHRMVIAALYENGAEEKQWYLYEIADELGLPIHDWDTIEGKISRGIAPK